MQVVLLNSVKYLASCRARIAVAAPCRILIGSCPLSSAFSRPQRSSRRILHERAPNSQHTLSCPVTSTLPSSCNSHIITTFAPEPSAGLFRCLRIGSTKTKHISALPISPTPSSPHKIATESPLNRPPLQSSFDQILLASLQSKTTTAIPCR